MRLTTFSTGLSGLATSSQALNVVGNNLANVNTVGFKQSDISFSDVLGQQFGTPGTAVSGNIASIGLGAQVSGVRANFSQGSIQTTNNPLDVAVQGQGFLVVANSQGQFFTRTGNLQRDANGDLVSQSGANVQGYARDPSTGLIDKSALKSINIPATLASPIATSSFLVGMNLDANAAVGTQFQTTIKMYDTLGKPHTATMSLQKDVTAGATPEPVWRFDVTIPNNEVSGVAPADVQNFSLITGAVATNPPAAGALVFDGLGKLTSSYIGADPAVLPAAANLTIPASGVTLPQLAGGGAFASGIAWQLMDPNSATAASIVSGFAATDAKGSVLNASSQNGAPAGTMSSLSIQSDGTISALFSNGSTVSVGQIALARFSNDGGLVQEGGGLYAESIASGTALVGVAGDAGRGFLTGSALEQSNVDLASELTKIITFQRGYQANAKIITATDQIMQDTIQMKQ